jgi:hypothetical protein
MRLGWNHKRKTIAEHILRNNNFLERMRSFCPVQDTPLDRLEISCQVRLIIHWRHVRRFHFISNSWLSISLPQNGCFDGWMDGWMIDLKDWYVGVDDCSMDSNVLCCDERRYRVLWLAVLQGRIIQCHCTWSKWTRMKKWKENYNEFGWTRMTNKWQESD